MQAQQHYAPLGQQQLQPQPQMPSQPSYTQPLQFVTPAPPTSPSSLRRQLDLLGPLHRVLRSLHASASVEATQADPDARLRQEQEIKQATSSLLSSLSAARSLLSSLPLLDVPLCEMEEESRRLETELNRKREMVCTLRLAEHETNEEGGVEQPLRQIETDTAAKQDQGTGTNVKNETTAMEM